MEKPIKETIAEIEVFLRSYLPQIEASVNRAEAWRELQRIERSFITNRCFYLVFDLKEQNIVWSHNLPARLPFADTKDGVAAVHFSDFVGRVHPAYRWWFLEHSLCTFELFWEENLRRRTDMLKQTYSLDFPMLLKDDCYWWVSQHVMPLELDGQKRLVSHLTEYHISAPYEGQLPSMPVLLMGSDRRVDLEKKQLASFAGRFLKRLDLRKEELELVDLYREQPGISIPQAAQALRISPNTVKKYNRRIARQAKNLIPFKFRSAKDAVLFFQGRAGQL